jgi:thioredoxin reductase (NADPH)
MPSFDFDCAVIGNGPAGLVSSLYLGRYRRQTIQFCSGRPRAAWIPRTHNLLGYRGGISGAELLRRLTQQVADVGVTRVATEACLRKISGGFQIDAGDFGRVRVRKVILATGGQDVQPVIENVVRLRQQALLRYCPICDAYEYIDQTLGVLAQDEHGIRTALFLSRYGSRIELFLPSDMELSRELRTQCKSEKIRVHRGKLEAVSREIGRKGVLVKLEKQSAVRARVAYVALGFVVNDIGWRSIKGLKRAQDGRLRVDVHQKTSVDGLYAVGDCVEALAQISVAAGQAATAATAIHNLLRQE